MKIGVLLDEPKVIPRFDYIFYEVNRQADEYLTR